MKATVRWLPPMTFAAHADSGHGVIIDSSPDVGGDNLGSRPMEMVLMGMGGCSAIDVLSILSKARQAVSRCEVQLTAERAETIPKVFTRIHMHYVIAGRGVSEKSVARAISLSAEKYCSVTKMLEHTAEVTHDYEIHEAGS